MKDYSQFEWEDFAVDDEFLHWVKHPDENSNRFWNTFLESHPEKEGDIGKAREFIFAAGTFDEFSDQEKEKLRVSITMQLTPEITEVQEETKGRDNNTRHLNIIYIAAACLAGLVTFSAILFFRQQPAHKVTIQSAYGEKKEIFLPDSTKIVLNANSGISYYEKYDSDAKREVWLEGEAYFEVRHLNENPRQIQERDRFVVHVNGVDIEVLGTAFNVFSRHENARVSLNNGKIRVGFSHLNDIVMLQPGEVIEYTGIQKQYIKREEGAALFSAWKDDMIALQDTPVSEITRILKDNYGVSVSYSDSSILGKKLSGELPASNLEVLLEALSKTLQVKIQKNENTILFRNE